MHALDLHTDLQGHTLCRWIKMDGDCNQSLVPQQANRRAIREEGTMTLSDALAHEYEKLEPLSKSEDCMEGVMAFIEKRPAQWKYK